MKNNLTCMAAILCVCLLAVSGFSQPTQTESNSDEISKLVRQAMLEKQAVTITVKPGVCLTNCPLKNQPNPKGQKVTGRITEVTATSFTLENDKSLEQFLGRPMNFQVSNVDVQMIKQQNKVLRNLRIVGERSATIGLGIIALPLFFIAGPSC